MNIEGKKVYLRAIEPEDLEYYRENINDPETEKMVGGWSLPVASVSQRDWYNSIVGDRNNLRFTISMKDEDLPLGMVNLVDIDWKSGVAFSGIKLFKNAQRKSGIGFDTVMSMDRYAFDELRLNRIEGTILTTNIPSIKLYKKCGWVEEGIRRQSKYQSGEYYDEIFVSILREDFEQIRKNYGY